VGQVAQGRRVQISLSGPGQSSLPTTPEAAFASSSPGLHALHRVLASNAARTSAGLQMQTLPPGWVKAGDEYLGIFYENTETGERQREFPGGAAPAAPAAAPSAAAPAASSGGDLPPGWVKGGDEYLGIFYENTATGERQREHPGGAAPAAPAAAPAAAAPAASSGGPAPLPPGWTFDGDDYHGYFYKDPATGDRQRTHPVTGERDR